MHKTRNLCSYWRNCHQDILSTNTTVWLMVLLSFIRYKGRTGVFDSYLLGLLWKQLSANMSVCSQAKPDCRWCSAFAPRRSGWRRRRYRVATVMCLVFIIITVATHGHHTSMQWKRKRCIKNRNVHQEVNIIIILKWNLNSIASTILRPSAQICLAFELHDFVGPDLIRACTTAPTSLLRKC